MAKLYKYFQRSSIALNHTVATHAALSLVVLAAALVLNVLTISEASAQTLHYETETKVKLHMMGRIGNMMGNKPTKNEFFVNEMNMRTNDSDRSFSIFSIPKGTIATADKKKKTYYEMGFEEMASMFKAMGQDTRQKVEDSGYNPDDVEFSVSVEDLGQSEEIAGFTADKKLVRMEVKYTAQATDADGQAAESSGKFYALSVVSVGRNVPGNEIMEAFGNNYAEKMGDAFSRSNSGFAAMQQAFMTDERIQPAMEKLAEEMKKLEGAPLRTKTFLVLGPEDKELDVDAILNLNSAEAPAQKKKRRRGGLGRLAKNALKGQGISIGGEDEPADGTGGEITEQTILTETETWYTLLEIVADDNARFNMPGNYKMVDPPFAYPPQGEN